jgi:anti-sigma factor RsiW
MITCDAARELLLEAEPAELRGVGGGELAAHLRSCAACAARARYILEQQEVLARALDGLQSTVVADRRLAGARARPVRPVYRRWEILLPLAAAATVGGLFLARRHQPATPTVAPLRMAAARPRPLDVQVPAGQSVAVFQTANPNIVVIWSYRTGRP